MSRRGVAATCAALLVFAAGCATLPRRDAEPLRLSELSDRGDPARRASMRLVLEGLDADTPSESPRALSLYERALQIDPMNPWAYLAMARHHVDADPRLSLSYVDQARILLNSEPHDSPRVEAHLLGLQGAAYVRVEREDQGDVMLARAADLAPSVWSDGHLSAAELK